MRKGRRSPHCISDNSCDRPGRHLIHCNYSCPFVQFVGKNISLIISIALARDNFKLSQVVPVVVTKIDTLIDLGVKCLEGTTERSDGNRGRSPRIVVTESMCLEGSTPQDLPQSSIPLLAFV